MPLTKSASKEAFRTNVAEMIRSGKPRDVALAASYRNARQYGAKFAEGGHVRSEALEYTKAQRHLARPEWRTPVTVMEDFIGGLSPAKARDNALRDAVRGRDIDTMRGTGYTAPLMAPEQRFADGGGTPWIERTSAHGLSHQGMIHSAVPGRTDKLPISVAGGAYVVPSSHVAFLGQDNSAAGADVLNKMFGMGPYGGNPLGKGAVGRVKPIRSPIPRLGRLSGGGRFAAGGAPDHGPVKIVAAGGEFVVPPDKLVEKFGDLDRAHKVMDHWVVTGRKKHARILSKLPGPKR